MRKQGFTIIEVLLATVIATAVIGFVALVLQGTVYSTRLSADLERANQVFQAVDAELERGNSALASGGSWDYGELPGVLKTITGDLNRFRLVVSPEGQESMANGGLVYAYKLTLCYRPPAGDEVCREQKTYVPPPPARQASTTGGGPIRIEVTGDDPTGSAAVDISYDDGSTETLSGYGTVVREGVTEIHAKSVTNAQGIRFSPTVSAGAGNYLVTYKALTGAIRLNISTANPSVHPTVNLSGPKSGSFTSSTHIPEAPPGSYEVSAPEVPYGDYTYAPEYGGAADGSGQFSVEAGRVTNVSVHMAPKDGALDVVWRATPTGPVLLKDANGDVIARWSGGKHLARLAPGSYRISPDGTLKDSNYTYALQYQIKNQQDGTWSNWTTDTKNDGVPVPIRSGHTTEVEIRPTPTTGALEIVIRADAGTSTPVKVHSPFDPETGKSSTWDFTSPGNYHLSGLPPGSYGLILDVGKKGDAYYIPSGPSVITVEAGRTSRVNIDYTAVHAGTIIVVKSIVDGLNWPNEPKPHSVNGRIYQFPRSHYVAPNKTAKVCVEDGRGTYIDYAGHQLRVSGSLIPSGCISVSGNSEALTTTEVYTVHAPKNTYAKLTANTSTKPRDYDPRVNLVLSYEDPSGSSRTALGLYCYQRDFARASSSQTWTCVQEGRTTAQVEKAILGSGNGKNRACEHITVRYSAYQPGSMQGNESMKVNASRAYQSFSVQVGEIIVGQVEENCP